ncbi:HAMP domain-containing histidine kinase [Bariatricus massiliensis]|uniref:histidine kinase n=1 Tax=Bariatricus massiliensis TaxID=1745713 RepID=A0ABS8DFA9_9FIRM|nr:HAMP domain-containing sensor histidine kinase [Bariatricus massiliensis]MCB7303988.1 HAMP domain-containing histidine kinase [Bariatricus massiliensis]MCB7374581.1 HAMP domain-containing histidine kinase [Bariatricus massiliensis]MCB7387098.1 HAMP domain-containing histidine kinase [Bariatricus massiliensis]MCB7411260.1 HAMP domain-containing histidine kinase [Bariatricus massiliensis]MCQ5252796.1 HAMP domain-containing histidine kinase [Bariatricus massiliensis]
MIHKLRKKLTLAYTITVGMILACVLAVILIMTEHYISERNADSFEKITMEILSKLQYSSSISQLWLTEQEIENQLIIHIEENAVPFLFPGSYPAQTDRDSLIKKVKELAREQQVNTDAAPISTSLQRTDVMAITGSNKDSYLACAMVLPSQNGGFKSIVLLHDNAQKNAQIMSGRIVFLITGLFGIAAIFLVSWFFVGHSLKPLAINREKQNAFVAAASHELRSPLAVIDASSSAILADPSKCRQFLSTIQKECKRMARLVNDMLVLASADTKGWQVAREHVDMDTLLLDTYEHYEQLCSSKHLNLTLSLPDAPLPPVLGDKERLEQILSILIDNAMAYGISPDSDAGGRLIELKAESSKHHLSISVADHGPGIADDKKPQIFDRFYRTDQSRKDKSHFGLGLSVAKELANLHEAGLTLTDTPGGGCTFTLRLKSL